MDGPELDEYATDVALAPRVADSAIVAAFEAYHAEILSFLRRATRDDEVAEDLTQETFLRLMRELRQGRAPDNTRAWLYRVASNLVTSRGRRLAVATAWLRRQISVSREQHGEPPEAGVLRGEHSAELEVALATVSSDARTALLLSAQGFSGPEIGEAIGRTHGATRSLMARARVSLRAELERREARA
jgi:RNA polymerase sigma-70 factor (ECF subfamily)